MQRWFFSLVLLGVMLSCNNTASSQLEDPEVEKVKPITKVDTTDWMGVYKGTVPSTHDVGIDMKLTLNPSNTYSLHLTHLRANPNDNIVKEFAGKIHWKDDSTTIVLKEIDSISNMFKIKPGKVIYLNRDATPNTGSLSEFYTLKKY